MKQNTSVTLLLTLAGVFGLSSPVFAASDNGTLTVGSIISCSEGPSSDRAAGFGSGAFGSYSPTTLTGGTSVVDLWNNFHLGTLCGSGNSSRLQISGFSVDPGQDWLSSIECNGVTNDGTQRPHFPTAVALPSGSGANYSVFSERMAIM